jgi:predicted MPP superfamily phosphohydrolase
MTPADALLVALIAIGHFSLMIAAVNWGHGLGITSRWMEPVAGLTMIGLGLLSLAGLGAMLRAGPAAWPPVIWGYAASCLVVSVVLLPGITTARWLRRPPPGVRGWSAIMDLGQRYGDDGLAGSGRGGLLLRLPGNDSLKLQRRQWSVPLAALPPALDGLSMLHLSDLHFSRAYGRRYFEAVAAEAAAMPADLVLFTGDLLDDDACLDWVVPVLGRLRGRLGTYAILGNHDLHHHPERLAAELERAGYRLLVGTWDRLDVEGVPVAIGGTFEPWGPPLEDPPPEAGLRIVLSHTPDRVYDLARRGVDLVLAGHNHGGQARLPGFGPVLMPSLYGRRFDEGFFPVGPTVLHVSRGVGAKYPLRFRCPPEVSLLLLRPGAIVTATPHTEAVERRRVR